MIEPTKFKDLTTNDGGAREEQRYVEQWRAYKAWYSAQPGNRVML
jgi:hypothetical protein